MTTLLLTMLATVAAAIFSTWYLKNEADANWKARREAWERHPSYRLVVALDPAYRGQLVRVRLYANATGFELAARLASHDLQAMDNAMRRPLPPGRHRAPRWWERRR